MENSETERLLAEPYFCYSPMARNDVSTLLNCRMSLCFCVSVVKPEV
jgi:hypothetical protein